uniref:Si:zfos-1011f11.2 n=1 Tax=Scleropages formosus TaxID=113540 RepID=A0A8D0CCE3_SCLFO
MSVRAGRLVLLCVCLAVTGGAAVHVTVADRQRHAMLFQPVELRCHFSSSSSQVPVVQWWYKSYCHDDTRSSFGLPQPPVPRGPGSGADARLDCADSGRTVRPVASGQGSSMTLGEYYRGRDIAIINSTCAVSVYECECVCVCVSVSVCVCVSVRERERQKERERERQRDRAITEPQGLWKLSRTFSHWFCAIIRPSPCLPCFPLVCHSR